MGDLLDHTDQHRELFALQEVPAGSRSKGVDHAALAFERGVDEH
jgi:hypothetical protein